MLADFSLAAWPQHYALWNSTVDESCAAGLPSTPWFCLMANFSYPFIAASMFITQALTDEVCCVFGVRWRGKDR
jgi:hypothetical protein